MPPRRPIDPLTGPRFALAGRVVTMNAQSRVIPRGVVYVDQGAIVAVQSATAAPPPGFSAVRPIDTAGTLFPGLIELHNHLPYDILRLWQVPAAYRNRDQWGRAADYQRLVTDPMTVVGKTPAMIAATVRYVECKCLFGGVTTSQGIALFSNAGATRYYRGIVRNVEQTDDAALPEAKTRVADVEAADAAKFKARLARETCLLLHLSEGIDARAREHFLALRLSAQDWAISEALAGIHCAGLQAADFRRLEREGGQMVWSPLSNLLLYGATAKVKQARSAGVRIGIGSDWSVSGSKNLFGELKVARLVSQAGGGVFTDREIVAMATRDAAAILKWDRALGSLEAGKRADLLVIDSSQGDPYAALLEAAETEIALVVVNGVPRFGTRALMAPLGAAGESIRVGGRARRVFLAQETADPVVGALTLAAATDALADGLAHLPRLARDLARPPARPRARGAGGRAGAPRRAYGPAPVEWSLALDELTPTGNELRPRLSLPGRGPAGPALAMARAPSRPLAERIQPAALDPLTVADDEAFLDSIERQGNLPAYLATGLRALFGG